MTRVRVWRRNRRVKKYVAQGNLLAAQRLILKTLTLGAPRG